MSASTPGLRGQTFRVGRRLVASREHAFWVVGTIRAGAPACPEPSLHLHASSQLRGPAQVSSGKLICSFACGSQGLWSSKAVQPPGTRCQGLHLSVCSHPTVPPTAVPRSKRKDSEDAGVFPQARVAWQMIRASFPPN